MPNFGVARARITRAGRTSLVLRVAGYEDFGIDIPRVNFAKTGETAGIRDFRMESSSDGKHPDVSTIPPRMEAKGVAG